MTVVESPMLDQSQDSRTSSKLHTGDSVEPIRRIEKVKKASSFPNQRRMLYASYKQYSVDVRVVLRAEYWIGFALAWTVLQLCNMRLFFGAICNGFCVQEDYDERFGSCLHCDWYHISRGDAYCRGCSCPSWIGSKLKNKLRLANFRCPKGLFGRARGWLGRVLGAARHSSVTPTVQRK